MLRSKLAVALRAIRLMGRAMLKTAAELSDGEYTALTSRVRSSRPVSSM